MKLLIGTDEGVFAMAEGTGAALREEGPESVAHLSAGPDAAYAVTAEGALWRRSGGEWRVANEHPVNEAVWSLAADPLVAGLVYLGVHTAILHRSADGGMTWKACESIKQIPSYERWTFPGPPHIPHVRSIAPDPFVEGGVYIGVEEGGIYHSADEGETWESLNEGLYWDVHTVHPTGERGLLYATTGNGFYRTDDGGQHWRHQMAGMDGTYTSPCVADPARRDVIYTAAADGPPPYWRRNDRGALAAMYRSNDGGFHWERLAGGLPEAFHAMVRNIVLTSDGRLYADAGQEVYASNDSGESWFLAAGDLPNVRSLSVL